MHVPTASLLQTSEQKLSSGLEQLQRSTILLALPGLFLGVLVLGAVISSEKEFGWALATALGLLLLIPVLWFLSRQSFLLASLALSLGVLGAVLVTIQMGHIQAAAGLLFLPVGLAALTLGAAAGGAAAVLCSALVLFGPGTLQLIPMDSRVVGLLSIWGALGIIWLTLRPLLTAVDWSWNAYEHSHQLLVQAREYQSQLFQALEDLKNANTQLNRLNALANNLRQVAEDEQRIKAQFVSNVSHELRTPLNMIIGFCEMMLKSPESYGQNIPANLLADLQVILRNSQHLSGLIDDVLDLSQIEAGQMALVKEWVDIKEIVEGATIAVQPLYASKGLYLETAVQENLPPIFCDRTRIREVLLNLLSNAGRFTEQGGVRVRMEQEGSSLLCSVTDTGPGITEEDQQRLFQPFQQLDNSIRRRHGGTGLGLSISKSFIELHDGKMWVESAKGRGTSFSFRLPVEPAAPLNGSSVTRWINPYITAQSIERRPRSTSLPLVDNRPRVLVIEKGSVLQRLLRRYLTDVNIAAVTSLESARAELDHAPARVVLLNDLEAAIAPDGSPRAPGPASLGWLPPSTPLITCAIAEQIQYAPGPDVPEILVKPISRDALLGALVKLNRPIQTILVVDDETDAQKLFVRMLASAQRGYHVLRAGNGIQALELLHRQPVDLVLLDLIMPEMDGFTFLKIKAQEPALREIPVVLISARDPHGQPLVSNYLSATRSGGLTVQQLLDCIHALTAILAPGSDRVP